MKISELPEPLKSLAEKRRSEYRPGSRIDNIRDAFPWESPESYNFWQDVHDGKDVSNHPMYPKPETKLFLIIEDCPDEQNQTITHLIEAYDIVHAIELCGVKSGNMEIGIEIIKTGKPSILF